MDNIRHLEIFMDNTECLTAKFCFLDSMMEADALNEI